MATGLQRTFSARHVQLLTLGGTIGAGLFLNSGAGIHQGGSGLILAYILAGGVAFVVAKCLVAMALEAPEKRTFVDYVRQHLGESAAVTCGWSYWYGSVLAVMIELDAAGMMYHFLVPWMPQWVATAIGLLCIYLINRSDARVYGEFAFWMTLLKVIALSSFILYGLALLLTSAGGGAGRVGFGNLWAHSAIFPNGVTGFLGALSFALVSFGGVELIGIAAAETRDPANNLPRAVNDLGVLLQLLYAGSMLILLSIVPWREIYDGTSPFALALQHLEVPTAATLITIVLCCVFVSCCNSTLYGAARVLSSLAVIGWAPAALGRLDARRVPGVATGTCAIAVAVTTVLNYLIPDRALVLLLSAAVAQFVLNWILFLLSHLRFIRQDRTASNVTSGEVLLKWCNYGALAVVVTVVIVLVLDPESRYGCIFSATFFGVIAILVRLRRGRVKVFEAEFDKS
jgi:L-asparagine transporter-like permease